MTCEEAANLISARLDGEAVAGDALDGHLAACAGCRAAADQAELQDAALVRAFAPRGAAAAALARRVADALDGAPPGDVARLPARRRSDFLPFAGWAVAAAAGIVLAIVLVRPTGRQSEEVRSPHAHRPTVDPSFAFLAASTGDVFTCPPSAEKWQPMQPGDALTAGDRVRTSDASHCELRLADGSRLRLNAGTEARFAEARSVLVLGGQLWSSVPAGAMPLRVTSGNTRVTARPPADGTAAQFDLRAAGQGATITVLAGAADVAGDVKPTTVRGGEFLCVGLDPSAPTPFDAVCVPVANPGQVTRWQDELLLLRPPTDPELLTRVAQCVAQISAERIAAAKTPGPAEEEFRARGGRWSLPLAAYLRTAPGATEHRRTAASLLADLATADCVNDLIELLTDADAEVRAAAAVALGRLTGRAFDTKAEWQNWHDRFRITRPPLP